MARLELNHVSVPVSFGKENIVAGFFVEVLGFWLDRTVGSTESGYFAQFVANGISTVQIAGDIEESDAMSPVHLAFLVERESWCELQMEVRFWCHNNQILFEWEDIGGDNHMLTLLQVAFFKFEFMIR